MDTILEQVKAFADSSHGEQQRKYSPDKYIVHPVRVMENCRRYFNSLPVLSAALLHDILEDTTVTRDQLYDFLLTLMSAKDADDTLRLVCELTDVYTKAKFPGMNRRQRKARERDRLEKISPEGQTIKYADIMDNVTGIAGQDMDFAPVFLRECKALLNKMTKGIAILRFDALAAVEEEWKRLQRDTPF